MTREKLNELLNDPRNVVTEHHSIYAKEWHIRTWKHELLICLQDKGMQYVECWNLGTPAHLAEAIRKKIKEYGIQPKRNI